MVKRRTKLGRRRDPAGNRQIQIDRFTGRERRPVFEALEERLLLDSQGLNLPAIFPGPSNQTNSAPATSAPASPAQVTPTGGTWTPLNSLITDPSGAQEMMLLSDGTVLVQGGADNASSNWYRLTPDSTGSYVNGTWSTVASANLQRLFFASSVMTDGRVFVLGGEYSGPSTTNNWTNTGEIYDPVANTWTNIPNDPQSSQFGDDPSDVLPNGTVLVGSLTTAQTEIYNPTTNTWTAGPNKLYGDRSDEETWLKMADGSILSYDVFGTATDEAQRYVPSLNEWVDAGTVPVALQNSVSELGPGALLPDGRAIIIGATSATAIYTPPTTLTGTGSWTTGPVIPGGLGANDAPGAELPNGDMLFAVSTEPGFGGPTSIYDFNPTTNAITLVTGGPTLSQASFLDHMLMLPNGQMLFDTLLRQMYVYTPTGSPSTAWEPTITSIVNNGNNVFTLTGTQLNGISEGGSYGDDAQMASNYPIIQLVNQSGVVSYARSYNWSSTGVATGSTPETVQFSLPAGASAGPYQLTVSANGISSSPFTFSAFQVTSSTPANGAVLSTPPVDFTIQFSVPYDPASVQASALAVNGIAATSFTLTNSTTITFHYASSPVTAQGLQTISMATGAIENQSDNGSVSAFSASFRYDVLQMQVTSATPASGSIVTLPFSTITLAFNEAYAAGSIGTNNLTLNEGTVSGFTLVDSTHVQYTVSGLSQEGTFTYSVTPGTITDAFGNPGPTFNASYTLDFGTVPFPVPLASVAPSGSLIWTSSISGSVGTIGDTDSFTLALDAGQTLSLVATAGSTLQPRIDLSGPGLSTSALSSTAGQSALLESATIATAGTYTITISGLNSTTGSYTLVGDLNAAIQTEGNGGATNDTLATAQNISGSFVSLGGASTSGAVVGALSNAGPVVASDDFESGTLGPDWTTDFSDPSGVAEVTGAYGPPIGNYSLFLNRTPSGTSSLNEAIWTVNLAGVADPIFSFDHLSSKGDIDGGGGDPDNFGGSFTGHYVASGVAISSDGVTWYPLWDAGTESIGSWQNFQFNLGAAAAADGITPGANFEIKLQQFDDGVLEEDGGSGWDDLLITPGTTMAGWYAFNATAGQTITLDAKGATAAVNLGLYDSAGDLLASGATDGANVDQAINNFVAPTTGTYYARVFGQFSTTYSLVASVDTDFDNELNGTLATAQKIGSQQVAGAERVLGNINSGASVNVYEVQLAGSAVLQASTTTPGDGSGEPENVLDPQIQVFNSSGTLVAANDNSAPDGRNAQLSYNVPAGAGGTYYVQVSASPLTAQPTVGDYVLQVQGASINHAPVLNTSVAPTLPGVVQNSVGGFGVLVSSIIATGAGGHPISDADAGAVQGIAITAVDTSHGTWQYSLNAGTTWTPFGTISASSSLLLSSNANTRIRFLPTPGSSGTIANALSFLAWDQTAGTNGGTIDTEVTGGSTAFSSGLLTAAQVVTTLNAAPVLNGANALSAQVANNVNSAGTLVSALVAGEISDTDLGALPGIAVTAANTANGSWQYSTTGSGGPWLSLGAVSNTSARLLAADANTLVRFVPNSGFAGTLNNALTFRAWDETDGNADGSLANTTSNGGSTAYSTATASTTLTVAPLGDTRSWSGGGPDNNWSDGANWVGGVAPSPNDNLIFPVAALSYTSVDNFAAGIQFRSVTIAGSGYTISGNGIALLEGFVDSATGNDSFTVPVTLAAAQTFINANASSTLTLGSIDTGTLQLLTFDGSGTTNVSGVISDSGGITKNGAGTLILSGSNTYLGLTTVAQGVLSAQNNTALGDPGAGTTVNNGAALQVQGNATIAEPLTIAGSGIGATTPGGGLPFNTLGALRSTGGSNTWTGNIVMSTVPIIGVDAGSELNLSGSVTDTSTGAVVVLEKTGAGQLDLTGSAPNSLAGTTTVLQGTLFLNKSGGQTAIQGSLIIGDNIEGDNASVVRLGSSNQIPQIDPTGTTLLSITLNSSGLLDLNGFNDTIGSLTLTTGQTYSADITTGSGILTLGGSLTQTAANGSSGASPASTISGFLDLGNLSFSGGITTLTSRNFVIGDTARVDDASDLTISAVISGAANVALGKSGNGTLTLTGANTYSGPTTVTAGNVEIGSSSAFGSGLLSLNVATLRAVGGPQSLANPVSFDGALTVYGTNNLTFTGPATLTGTRGITVLSPTETTTFTAGIGEGYFSGSGLTKSGPGTLALTGTNTYTGLTTVSGGTLTIGGSGTLLTTTGFTVGSNATLRLDNTTTNLANRLNDTIGITLSGGSLDFAGAAGAASSETVGVITLTANLSSTIESDVGAGGSAVLTAAALVNNSGASVNFVGTGANLSASGTNQINFIATPVALTNGILPFATVTGSGGLDLATYVGNTTGVGLIALPAADYVTSLAAAGPTSNVKLTSNDTSNGKTINALLIAGSGVNVGAVADTLTVSSGAVIFSGGGTNSISVGNLNLGAQAFITTDPSSTATISSVVTGAGTSLTKAGTGTLILSGANQFAGIDDINQGVLNIQNSAALGATSAAATVNAGATLALQDPGSSPVVIGAKPLTIVGTGFNSVGALENVSGSSNSWAGTIALTGVSIDSTTVLNNFGGPSVSATFIDSSAGQLSLTGVISGSSALVTLGSGTVALGGVLSNTFSGSTIVEQGTLLLNKVAGLNALGASAANIYVGNDLASAAPGQLMLGASNQIFDTTSIRVGATGTLNFNNFSDVVGSLSLTIGPNGSSNVTTGSGTLTLGTSGVNVDSIGSGNPSPATISGNLALNTFTAVATVTRTFTVNDGAVGDDLIILATISDGNGLFNGGITKQGLGTLQFAGSTANTYTGATTVNEGTLELNKTPGATAFSGPLTVGDGSLGSGGSNSDVVRLLASNQLPDAEAAVTINDTGLLDLNGFSDTIGTAADVTALTLNGGNITTGAGTLTLNGDLVANSALSVLQNSATISGNLNLGSASRTFTVNNFLDLPYNLIISANISGAAGVDLTKASTGALLLSGNNTYAGRTYGVSGTLAVGSDTALGTGPLFLSNGASVLADSGPHAISNPTYLAAGLTLAGGNTLTFSGPANLTASTTITVTNAMFATFSAGIGETTSGLGLTKSGSGFLFLTGQNTYDGATAVSGGWLTLKDNGTAVNSSSFTVSPNATLRLDNNSAANLTDRIGDSTGITLNGGTLLYIGAGSAASSETLASLAIGISSNSTFISQAGTTAGSSVALTIGSLARTNLTSINFVGAGVSLGATNQIAFTTAPTETGTGANAILPYATVLSSTGQVDLATLSGASNALVAFTAYSTGNINSAATGSVYLLDGFASPSPQTLTASKSFNAVLIRGTGLTLTGNAGQTLNLAAGQIVSAGGPGNTVSVSTLDFGTAEGNINTAADLAISSTITGTNPIGISKIGTGTLTLSGSNSNTYTGQTVIAQGVVNVQKNGALGATIANAVQVFTITNPSGASNTFNMTFNGQFASISYTASAGTVQTDLNALSTIGGVGGSVTVSNPTPGSNPDIYTITFGGSLAGIAQPNITVGSFNYAGTTAPTFATTVDSIGGYGGDSTTILGGAALLLSGGVTETGEQLSLNGPTAGGAFRGLTGNNTWAGPVVINSGVAIDVDPSDQLTVSDAVSGSGTLTKIGTGTLQYTGVNPNTFTGSTTVADGTLLLNKTAGVPAIANASLIIGNDVGSGTDQVQVSSAEQINSSAAVTINSTGSLQLLSGVATSTTQAEQLVTIVGTAGTFTLTFNGATTSSLAFNATVAAVQTALQQTLLSTGTGSCSVTGIPGAYVVLFTGTLANLTEPAMTIAATTGVTTDTVTIISAGGHVAQQTVGALTMSIGDTSSAGVSVAAGATLALNGTVTVNATLPGLNPSSPGAMISGGNLALFPQGSSGTRTITVNDSPAFADLLISSTITDAVGGLSSGFTKSGTGRLVLNPTSGSNTFSGAVTVSAGPLNIQQAGALGTASSTTVNNGATLELQGASVSGEALTLNGTGVGTAGALLNISGTNSWVGSITLASTSTIGVESGSQLTLFGAISGSGGLTKLLPGTLVFAGSTANTYTGTTTVSEGTLILNKTAGVDAIPAAPLIIGNDAGGAVSDVVQLAANSQIDSASAVTIDSTGLLSLNGFNQTLSAATALTMEFGPTASALVTTGAGALTLGGNVSFVVTGNQFTTGPAATISGNLNLGASTPTFTVATGMSLDDAQISATITGTAGFTKAGAGSLLISANNSGTYSGTTILSAGTLALGNNNALGTSILQATAVSTIRADTTAITLPNAVTLSAALTVGGNQNFTFGGTISDPTTSTSLVVTNPGTTSIGNLSIGVTGGSTTISPAINANVTVSGVISGVGGLAKGGLGRLTLGGSNSYGGSTTVSNGVLAVQNAGALNAGAITIVSGAALEISGGISMSNAVTINGSGFNSMPTGALRSTGGTNTWTGTIALASATANFIGVDSGQLTITGVISGGLTDTLSKVGAGALELGGSSSNTYAGNTFINQGIFRVNKPGNAIAVPGTVFIGDGGGGPGADIFQYGSLAGTQNVINGFVVGSSGLFDLSASAASISAFPTLVLDVAPGSSASVATGAATLKVTNITVNSTGATDGNTPAATISGNVLLQDGNWTVNDTLVPSPADDLVISAVVSGVSNPMTISGGGTVALTAADTAAIGATISSATVILRGAGTATNASFTIGQGGTLLLDNQTAGNLNNRLGSGSAVSLDGGTFSYLGAPGLASSETFGTLSVAGDDSVFQSTVSAQSGSSVTINSSNLVQSGSPATGSVLFAGVGADLGSATNQLTFTTTPPLTPTSTGIIPFARLQDSAGFDFAAYGASGIKPGSYVTSLAAAGPNDNVKLTASETLSGSKSVNAILFAAPNVTANLNGNTLTVNSGAIATTAVGSVISGGSLALASQGVVVTNSGDDLTISSSISGSGGLLKAGTGTLVLSSANSYSGETDVSQGVLNIRNASALGTAGISPNDTVVVSGAGLELQGNINVGNESLTLSGTGPGNNGQGALRNVSGINSWAGAVALVSTTANVGVSSGQLILSGIIGAASTLVEVGPGILQMAGTSSNSNLTVVVDQGTLQLNKSSFATALTLVTVGDGVGGPGTANLVMLQAQQFFGPVASVTVNNSGVFDWAGFSQTLSSLTVNDGLVTDSGGASTLALTSAVTMNGGTISTGLGTLSFTTTLTYVIAVNSADQATISGQLNTGSFVAIFNVSDGPATDDLVLSAKITGTAGITKSGAGTMLISSSNSYSGATLLSVGTLALSNAQALGSSTLTASAATTLRGDGGSVSIANTTIISSTVTLGGRRDVGGTNTGIDLTGPVTLSAAATITVDDPLVSARIDGNMGGSVSLTKAGNGTLVLAGSNSYTGTTTVSAGILNIQNSNALGTTAGGTVVGSGAELDVQGNLTIGNEALTVTGLGFLGNVFGTGDNVGVLNVVSGTSTWGTGATSFVQNANIFVGAASGSQLTLSGTLAGGGFAWNKVGLGTIQLAGTAVNTLTGTTTVNDGILQLNKSAGVDAIEGPLVVGDNAGSGTDTVQQLARQQVLDAAAATVTVNSTGLWDLSGITSNSSEVQTVAISGMPTGGTFTLSYNGQTTSPLAYNAPANGGGGDVQSALAALTNIGTGNVSVSGTAGGPYTITFTGTLAGVNVSTLTASGTLLTGGTASTVSVVTTTAGGVGQIISTAALVVGTAQSAAISTGSSILSLDGASASNAIFVSPRPGITASTPATISGNLALVSGALSLTRIITVVNTVPANGLVVSANVIDGTLPGSLTLNGAMVFSGNNTYSGLTNVTSGGALTLQSSTALGTPVTSAVQTVTYTGATAGSFTLTFSGQTTAAISYNAMAAAVQGALAALSNVGAGNVAVASSGAGSYTIMFQGALAGISESTMTLGNSLTGASNVAVTQIITGGGGTVISSGAALDLQGSINIAGELLNIGGIGLLGTSSTATGTTNAGIGALHSVSGTNVWGGNITLTAATTVAVDTGQLTLSGIMSGSFGLTTVGAGTTILAGASSNTFTALTANAGLLVLDKISGATAVNGNLTVGDNFGGQDADIVQYGPSANLNQVIGVITIESSGRFDLATNGASYNNSIVTVVGPASSADFAIGSAAQATVTFTDTGIALAGTSATSPAASISGILPTTNAHTFNIFRSGATDDLNVSAIISGAGGVTKTGLGTLVLSASNTYSGVTTLNANSGTVVVTSNNALGAAGLVTTVNAGSTLAFRGGVGYTTNALITLNGIGVVETGALTHNGAIDNLGGSNSFAGTITLATASAIGVTAGSLALNGAVSGSFPLSVNGFGTLISGASIGATSVTVNNATLAGSGTITGPVTLITAGAVSPGSGATAAILNTGSLTLDSGGTYVATLNGATAGTGYSQTNVTGTVNLAGATFNATLNFVPTTGESFTLINNDGSDPVVGTFNGLPQGSLVSIGGVGFKLLYNGGDGNDVVLTANNAPSISGSTSLASIVKNATNNSGTLVSALIAGGLSISDPDAGAAQGIAIDAVDNTNGSWQFSTNGGSTWTALGSPTDTAARLLASDANTRVRYVPNAGYSGTVATGLTMRAWDQSSGSDGGTADASTNGASTPFSSGTATASILVDAPPVVVGAFVSGTAWSSAYLDVLDAAGLGSSTVSHAGFELASGAAQLTTMVPWNNVTTLSIALSEGVSVTQSSLTLLNSENNTIASTSFSYNSGTFIATWQFPTLAADKYLINLSAATVSDAIGTALDGDWTTSASTFAAGSGDGTPGGDFNFFFDVLPGDTNSNGIVSNSDLLSLKTSIGAVISASNYQKDINASDGITNGDLLALKTHIGNNINNFATPSTPAPAPLPAALLPATLASNSPSGAADTTPAVVSVSNVAAPAIASPIAPAVSDNPISDVLASPVVADSAGTSAVVVAGTSSPWASPSVTVSGPVAALVVHVPPAGFAPLALGDAATDEVFQSVAGAAELDLADAASATATAESSGLPGSGSSGVFTPRTNSSVTTTSSSLLAASTLSMFGRRAAIDEFLSAEPAIDLNAGSTPADRVIDFALAELPPGSGELLVFDRNR